MSDLHKVQPIPEHYGSVTPYIIVKGVAQFVDFLKEAFGAVERGRVHNDDGTIGHAEVWIGDSVVMMFDAKEDWPESPSFLTLYVEDCDKVHRSALKAGATTVTDLSTNAWGDRGVVAYAIHSATSGGSRPKSKMFPSKRWQGVCTKSGM